MTHAARRNTPQRTDVHARRLLIPALSAWLAVVLFAPAVFAQIIPQDEGFMKPPKSVQNRTHALNGKSDIAAFFGTSIKARLTQHFHGYVDYDFNFSEYLALDVLVGGGAGTITNLTRNIRDTARLNNTADDLADAGGLLFTSMVGIRFTPAYGKIMLASEFAAHFSAYFVGGLGLGLINYNSVLACSSNLTGSRCPGDNFKSEIGANVAFNVGVGFRFFVTKKLSARVELRDVVFPDRFYENVNLKTPDTSPGNLAASPGLTQLPIVLVGVGFVL